jgi:hypothetical protein
VKSFYNVKIMVRPRYWKYRKFNGIWNELDKKDGREEGRYDTGY